MGTDSIRIKKSGCRVSWLSLITLISLWLFPAHETRAQYIRSQLSAGDTVAGDYFGSSVAASANLAIIGAYGDKDAGDNTGAADVLR